MKTATTTTEKREALKIYEADRLVRIGRIDKIADNMEIIENMTANKVNKEYELAFNYERTGYDYF